MAKAVAATAASATTKATATRLLLLSLPFLLRLLPLHPLALLLLAAAAALYLHSRPSPALLLDYSCYLPPAHRRCTYEVSEYFVRSGRRYSPQSEHFMRGIYLKSGLGDETYAPPFLFKRAAATHADSLEEADDGMFAAVDDLLAKTGVAASEISTVIVTCGMFSPVPSLSARLVRRYSLPASAKTFNLSGMGCGSGVMAVDLAARILSASRRTGLALVVVTESIGQNWYFGDDRSMLVTNCIFRVGCAAALVTTDPARRGAAKLELLRSTRTHRGADDYAFRAAFQQEDPAGNLGVALTKDLIRVAGDGLREHVRSLAPHVLPPSQLLLACLHHARRHLWQPKEPAKPYVPDFSTAFEHMCIHTGGKAVIESVARAMRLDDDTTEPARMTLHRFGNTSSSLVFYELAYFEAKGRIKEGDRIWMLAFGTGFKVCSLVWRSLRNSRMEPGNPWIASIHRYPLKAW